MQRHNFGGRKVLSSLRSHRPGTALCSLQRSTRSSSELLPDLRRESSLSSKPHKKSCSWTMTAQTRFHHRATKYLLLIAILRGAHMKEQLYILEVDEEFMVISITDRGAKLLRRGFNSREEALAAFPQAG